MIDCMYTCDNIYRIETDMTPLVNRFLLNCPSKYLCRLSIYDNIMGRKILELVMDENSVMELCSKLYTYMEFGFDGQMMFNVRGSYQNNYSITLINHYNEYPPKEMLDYLIIDEIDKQTNVNVTKLKIAFNDDDDGTDTGLMQFFVLLYDSFLTDIVPLEEIAPDYCCY